MKRKRNEVYVAGYCFTLNKETVNMPAYCIKTVDIPAEELSQWHDVGYFLENSDIKVSTDKPLWVQQWFSSTYLYIDTSYFSLLIASETPPLNPYSPLTLSILKTLALLKLTGDSKYDSNNTLSLSSTTED